MSSGRRCCQPACGMLETGGSDRLVDERMVAAMQQSDTLEQLVRRSQRGDPSAFARLIDRFERSALATAFSVLGDSHAAADVTQEAFLRAWQRLGEVRRPEQFAGWLLRMVRNLSIDAARRRGACKPGELPDSVPAPRPTPPEEVDQSDERSRIEQALQSLDEISRTAVVLRYYQGLSSREIGEVLSLSPAAVDMRLSRSRERLRELLGDATRQAGARASER